MKNLRKAEDELFEKIEALKSSIEYQKDVLVNWREEDNALQSATDYRNEMIEDMKKLDMLMDSYILVLFEMINTI
jgi:predicted  nucleic acid-binding Zn-ribbon protein